MKVLALINFLFFNLVLFANDIVLPSYSKYVLSPYSHTKPIYLQHNKCVILKKYQSSIEVINIKNNCSINLLYSPHSKRIHFLHLAKFNFYNELKQLIKQIPSASIQIKNNQITIDATYISDFDYQAIERLYINHYRNYTKLLYSFSKKLMTSKSFIKRLKSHFEPSFFKRIKLDSNIVYPILDISDEERLSLLSLGFQIKNNNLDLNYQVTVAFKLTSNTSSTVDSLLSNENINIQTLPKINLLAEQSWSPKKQTSNGHEFILSKKTLVVKNKHEGYFHFGGQIPIKSFYKDDSYKVSWKKYGLIYKCKVKNKHNNIILTIHQESTFPDKANHYDGIPSLITQEANTEYVVKLGQWQKISEFNLSQLGDSSIQNSFFFNFIPKLKDYFSSNGKEKNSNYLKIEINVEPYN